MRIAVMSDLHNEFARLLPGSGAAEWSNMNDADVIVLAGDTATGRQVVQWAHDRLPKSIPIVIIPGNHEYYGGEIGTVIVQMKVAAQGSNVTVLDNESIEIDGVNFIGTTLWTDYELTGDAQVNMALAKDNLSDHSLINHRLSLRGADRPFLPQTARNTHRAAVEFLQTALGRSNSRCNVVVTHHAPSGRSIASQFAQSRLNSCFASDLEWLIKEWEPHLWIGDYAPIDTHGKYSPNGKIHWVNLTPTKIVASAVIASSPGANIVGYPEGGSPSAARSLEGRACRSAVTSDLSGPETTTPNPSAPIVWRVIRRSNGTIWASSKASIICVANTNDSESNICDDTFTTFPLNCRSEFAIRVISASLKRRGAIWASNFRFAWRNSAASFARTAARSSAPEARS